MTLATPAGRPLTGQRVLVTRARPQAADLTARLKALGASVVALPAIEIVPVDPAPLDAALRQISSYDWLVLTSSNGVAAVIQRLDALGLRPSVLNETQVAAIGKATAASLRRYYLSVDLVPDHFVGESVVAALVARGVAGRRILLPQAEIARETVAEGLRQAGAEVDAIVAYRTALPDADAVEDVRQMLAGVDIATFASPSAVRNTLTLAGGTLTGPRVVCIGPVTAEAACGAGLRVDAVADEYSIDGLIAAVVRLAANDLKIEGGSR
ncbi:MAG TPA: uroporphyrinogen-III synthase [Thermomicrobiales bacterium]|nr:uroporphyrinogen-III synthase [Thermomicrobiales bacterium]